MEPCCRVCGRCDEFHGVSLESISEPNGVSFALMLAYCTQLEINIADLLPQQICCECLASLYTVFSFRKICRQNNGSLQRVFGQTENSESLLQKPFRCCIQPCTVTASGLEDLRLHVKLKHSASSQRNLYHRRPNYTNVCTVCQADFSDDHSWRYHNSLMCGSLLEQLTCGKCSKLFQTVCELAEHEVEHCTEPFRREPIGELEETPTASKSVSEETAIMHQIEERIRVVSGATSSNNDIVIRINEQEKQVILKQKTENLERFVRIFRQRSMVMLTEICKTCKYEISKSSAMREHLEESENFCRRSYPILRFYEIHSKQITTRCTSCELAFKNVADMRRHQQQEHNPGTKNLAPKPPQMYVCEDCGYPSMKLTSLRKHQSRLSHNGIKVPKIDASSTTSVQKRLQPNQLRQYGAKVRKIKMGNATDSEPSGASSTTTLNIGKQEASGASSRNEGYVEVKVKDETLLSADHQMDSDSWDVEDLDTTIKLEPVRVDDP